MINLKIRTEYSFRYAFGKIEDIITNSSATTLAITDRFTTFGHIPFWQLCKKQKKKAILGVELAFVENASMRTKQTAYFVTLIAINQKGLSSIYNLTSKSTLGKYYYNRLSYDDLLRINEDDVVIIFEDARLLEFLEHRRNTYYGISPVSNYGDYTKIKNKVPIVAISDNLYDIESHKNLYEIILGNGQYQDRNEPSHILTETEWRESLYWLDGMQKDAAIQHTYYIADMIDPIEFAQASLPHHTETKTLRELCVEGATKRQINLEDPIYKARLNRELDLIAEKKYEDYFYLVRDLIVYAKEHMLVGAARGSSAGSLVCYLLFITDIDPIPFDLIFERFIDINRIDLPDIDIDFQDTKRDMCIDYLKSKYGHDCVAKLGTVAKYKPKSILTELAKVLDIPQWQIKDLKEAIPERSGGDSRAKNCLEDTFNELDIGKQFIEKYPELVYSQNIEAHNRHYGQHAAGIVVSDKPIVNYCAMDLKEDHVMLDKYDAEFVNLLKMDCLGLRTLTVIQDCLDLIGKDRDWLLSYTLEDKLAFDVINNRKYSGIFQYEGYALQSVTKQMEIKNFNDVCLITALARPGTLISGGTTRYINARKTNTPDYLPLCEEYTNDTMGIIVYQEQVMNIVRNIGNLTWEDTSTLRKAMSKSYGQEYFDKFWERFKVGAMEKHGLDEKTARKIWDNVNTMGSWAFNKSHSVAYGLISYHCMVLKAHYPIEFALATLKNSKSEDQTIQILKELVNEGYKYKAFDFQLSDIDWTIADGVIIGGFKNIKGVGEKKATKLIEKRNNNKELTVAEKKLIFNAETPYDEVFEFEKFRNAYSHWNAIFRDKPMLLKDIDETGGEVRFLAKIVAVNLRDVNEAVNLKRRNGKIIEKGCLKFLDLKFADDTDTILGRINREYYEQFGKDIVEKNKIGDYYLVHGKCCDGFRYIIIDVIKKVTVEEINKKVLDFMKK